MAGWWHGCAARSAAPGTRRIWHKARFARLDGARSATGPGGGPRAYLTTIAQRLLSNHLRRRQIERAYLEALGALPDPVAPPPMSS
jgi:RNA polymerase sigma-70 factor (ECF subfamily)